MTEGEWLACADSGKLLRYMQGRASDRKLRLFAVSCCRRISNLLDVRCLDACRVAEQFAEGMVGEGATGGGPPRMASEAFNEFNPRGESMRRRP